MKIADHIDRLPSGRHRVRMQIDGAPMVEIVDTLDEAVQIRDGARVLVREGKVRRPKGPTVKDLGKRFLGRRRVTGNRNADTDEGRWNRHIATATFASMPARAVARSHVKKWLDELRAKSTGYDPKRHGERVAKKLSWQTVKHCLVLLRRFFTWCLDDDESLVTTNPCLELQVERRDGDEDEGWQPEWYLDPEDQAAFLACWDALEEESDRREKHIVEFLLYTGLRLGEANTLHIADVHIDADDPHIVVRYGGWDRKKKKYTPPKGRKGEKRQRPVPLLPPAIQAMKAWIAVRDAYAPKNPLGLAFPTERGARRDQKPPRSWKKAMKNFRIERLECPMHLEGRPWPHLLRHACATSLLSGLWGKKWMKEDVQAILGHTSITTTEHYAKLLPDALMAAARTAAPSWDLSRACHARNEQKRKLQRMHWRATQDSNLRPTAPEAHENQLTLGRSSWRDNVVTTIVRALRAIEEGEPTAMRQAIEALGMSLAALRSDEDDEAANGGAR